MIHDTLQIKSKTLTTRLVFPPMATHSSAKGHISADLINHYTAIAKNPLVGTIITEHAYVDPTGKVDDKHLHRMNKSSDNREPTHPYSYSSDMPSFLTLCRFHCKKIHI